MSQSIQPTARQRTPSHTYPLPHPFWFSFQTLANKIKPCYGRFPDKGDSIRYSTKRKLCPNLKAEALPKSRSGSSAQKCKSSAILFPFCFFHFISKFTLTSLLVLNRFCLKYGLFHFQQFIGSRLFKRLNILPTYQHPAQVCLSW